MENELQEKRIVLAEIQKQLKDALDLPNAWRQFLLKHEQELKTQIKRMEDEIKGTRDFDALDALEKVVNSTPNNSIRTALKLAQESIRLDKAPKKKPRIDTHTVDDETGGEAGCS